MIYAIRSLRLSRKVSILFTIVRSNSAVHLDESSFTAGSVLHIQAIRDQL
jgi:hypothetical protein